MSVDKVLALARTIVTIQMTLPQSKQTINRTILMKRYQRIAPLFADEFWGTRLRSQDKKEVVLKGTTSFFVVNDYTSPFP